MTDNIENNSKMPFGVMRVLGSSFSLLFRNLVLLLGLSMLIQAIITGLNYLITGSILADFSNPANIFALQQTGLVLGIISVISVVGYLISTALISMAAFDIKTNKRVSVARYLSIAFKSIVPLTVLTIVVTVLSGIPAIIALMFVYVTEYSLFVTIPLAVFATLYIFSMFSVVSPSIVIEEEGFRAFGRSRELTRGYRGKIIGLYAIIIFGLIILMMIVGVFAASVLWTTGSFTQGVVWSSQLINFLLTAVMSAFFSVVIAMVFARLKEIKEGYGFENAGDVFD